MKLKRLRLKDILPHESADVEIAPNVTVFAGESDGGKTCVMRGILQCLANRPSGIDLLRHGAGRGACGEVEAVFEKDDGGEVTVLRRRGKSRNEYELDGRPLLAFGQDVPVEVSSAIRLSAHAFHMQQEKHFLLADTDGQAAKVLSSAVGLSQIDAAFSEMRKRKTVVDDALREASGDFEREGAALRRFDGLDAASALAETAERLAESARALSEESSDARAVAASLRALPKDAGESVAAALKLVESAGELSSASEDASASAADARSLASALAAVPGKADRLARSASASVIRAEGLAESAGSAAATASLARALLDEILRVPSEADAAAADRLVREAAAAVEASDACAAMAALSENALNAVRLAGSDCAASAEELSRAEADLREWTEKHPSCPECGAERKYWKVSAKS